jgi:hypothetical protein
LQISQPGRKRLAVVTREQNGLGRHAVFERVESRTGFPIGGSRAGAFLRIATIGLDLCRLGLLGLSLGLGLGRSLTND